MARALCLAPPLGAPCLTSCMHDATPGAVAVAWTLSQPGVSGAIVGARSPEQVDGWLAAGSLVLDHKDLTEIATAIERTGESGL